MRIVVVTANFPHGSGEEFLEAELGELDRRGVLAGIFPNRGHRRPLRDLHRSLASVDVWTWGPGSLFDLIWLVCLRPKASMNVMLTLLSDRQHLGRNMLCLLPGALLAKRLIRGDADHVHAHWCSTSGTTALFAHIWSGADLSFSFHRWDIYDGNLIGKKGARSNFIRVISERGADAVAARLDEGDRSKVHVVHLGQSMPMHCAEVSRGQRIVCIANHVPVKGIPVLLKALVEVKSEIPHVQMDLIGDGPLREEYQELVAELGLLENVRFRGQLAHDVVMNELASGLFQALVLPSLDLGGGLHEGIPVSLMEAMSVGLPVVSTRTGSIPELIIDGRSGLLVEPGDPVELSRAIAMLLTDKVIAASLGEGGAERVRAEFEVQGTVQRLMSLMSCR